jgi:hypothetical protein
MKSLLIAGAIALDLISSPAFAASPADPAPKPGPEVQKLGYYIGSWEGHGETKAGPFGKAGKLSSHMKCSWFAGGYQVVCRGEETGPSGTRGFLNILAYDEETKGYTEYSISSFGEAEYDRGGSLVGNRLTFLVDAEAGGEHSKFRYTEIHLSPALLSYQAEMASKDGSWTMLAQGTITKVK